MNLCGAQIHAAAERVFMQSSNVKVDSLVDKSVARTSSGRALNAVSFCVRVLASRDRRKLLMHFLGLGRGDRLLRFGNALSDELVTRYVQRINFERDVMFGVFDVELQLVGVGHLVFSPRDSLSMLYAATERERIAELGVSVSEGARNLGIGSKLFARAAAYCRNSDVDTIYIHCLTTNLIMAHIAKKTGMEIRRGRGEAHTYLKLLAPNPTCVTPEKSKARIAAFDYIDAVKTRTMALNLETAVDRSLLPGKPHEQ